MTVAEATRKPKALRRAGSDPEIVTLQAVIPPKPGLPTELYISPGSDVPVGEDETLVLTAGRRFRANTFFNSFYLSYWRSHSVISRLGVTCVSDKPLGIAAVATFEGGQRQVISRWKHPGGGRCEVKWIWRRSDGRPVSRSATRIHLEIEAPDGACIDELRFVTAQPAKRAVRVALCLCTHNREELLAETLGTVLPHVLPGRASRGLRHVYLVNNGATFESASLLSLTASPAVTVIEQANLGGTGGFARAMAAAIEGAGQTRATHLLLMDDDIRLDPRILPRAMAFAAYAASPVALGGQSLEMEHPGRLQDGGGRIGRNWIVKPTGEGADLCDAESLTLWARPEPVDYAAWWFCLVPIAAVQQCGLPMPLFIHGDDVEYGCRLKAAGYETLAPPGLGLWHAAFRYKPSPVMRYYDLRNSLINAAIHPGVSSYPGMLHVLGWIVRDLLIHRYRASRAGILAVTDFLAGPGAALGPNAAARHRKVRSHVLALPSPKITQDRSIATITPSRLTVPSGNMVKVVLDHVHMIIRVLFLPRRDVSLVVEGAPQPELTAGRGYLLALDPKAENCLVMRPVRWRLLRLTGAALWQSLRYGVKRQVAARKWRAAKPDLCSAERWSREFATRRR